jgi:hypothetical protein
MLVAHTLQLICSHHQSPKYLRAPRVWERVGERAECGARVGKTGIVTDYTRTMRGNPGADDLTFRRRRIAFLSRASEALLVK